MNSIIDKTWCVWRWFTSGWWQYLLGDCRGWTNFWCRVKGHPSGPIFYNVGGSEPDDRCQDCGEHIGC
jgi:hypothetical protein